jgi:hypothetical protein
MEANAKSPEGTWLRREKDQIVVGASTRSAERYFMVPFTLWMFCFAIPINFYYVFIATEFFIKGAPFAIPFLGVVSLLAIFTLMSIGGRVEVKIGEFESSVFVGIGSHGWTRRFVWADVQTIEESRIWIGYPGGHSHGIRLGGKRRLMFGTNLNKVRRRYVLEELKRLKYSNQ